MGCPVGIGPEIIARSLALHEVYTYCRPVVVGDRAIMERAVKTTGVSLDISVIKEADIEQIGRTFRQGDRPEKIFLLPVSGLDSAQCVYGRPTARTGAAMVNYILRAIELALSGRVQAITTAPINKEAMHMAGYEYPGHTELLAEKTGEKEYAMMLAGDRLKVVPVTIHLPLRDVATRLTREKILENLIVTDSALRRYFGLEQPRLAVAALNPHAGEGGLFGDEEVRIIAPAIDAAKRLGIDAAGPFPADTVFYRASQGEFAAVIAMYHDQALIPLKLLHFKDGVNITLGLPIIRTSVDHGTAYDLAGSGKADPSSLLAALRLAARMAGHRN
ncbi:MAG: 4-hydroxythreonine-4-phosphate dehydrogenase PdxA [Thermodesulfobacteriota bacterium]|nr:4-hydroxythreonine-4-phosphate dehydrogenase PdxA [Thermodesulfobacteriota bacterium]